MGSSKLLARCLAWSLDPHQALKAHRKRIYPAAEGEVADPGLPAEDQIPLLAAVVAVVVSMRMA